MPLILGLLALFQAIASGFGAAIAYMVSRYSKQVLILGAWTAGLGLIVNALIDLALQIIVIQLNIPEDLIDLYNLFVPDNFLDIILIVVSFEISLFFIKILVYVAGKFASIAGS